MGYAHGGLQVANPTDSVRSASRSSSTYNPHVSEYGIPRRRCREMAHKGLLEQWDQQEWKEKEGG
jgi:ribosomal protein S14